MIGKGAVGHGRDQRLKREPEAASYGKRCPAYRQCARSAEPERQRYRSAGEADTFAPRHIDPARARRSVPLALVCSCPLSEGNQLR